VGRQGNRLYSEPTPSNLPSLAAGGVRSASQPACSTRTGRACWHSGYGENLDIAVVKHTPNEKICDSKISATHRAFILFLTFSIFFGFTSSSRRWPRSWRHRATRKMGLDQSKSSRQARTNIVDFPTRNHAGNKKDLDSPPQRGVFRQPPNLPPRSSSLFGYESSASTRSAAVEPRDKLYRDKSLRSCLSWEKETNSGPSYKDARREKAGTAAVNGKYPKGTCDKCDGAHLTDDCPIYKKKRDDHPDAWRNFGKKSPLEMGKGGCVPERFPLFFSHFMISSVAAEISG
jgi:hypothetical protein